MRAADAVVRFLQSAGVRYVFGNPGTTEIPLMDALVDADLTFVLCLQENVAVAAAEGLAQATRSPQVVNLHTGPGVAQAFAALYMASKHRAPVVVTAGNEDTRLAFSEPLLRADLVRMAEPLVKWAYEPVSADEVIPSLRRAFKVAQTPPTGPVLVSWPMDVLAREVPDDIDVSPAAPPSPAAPDPGAVQRVAELCAGSSSVCIVAGDDVARDRAELRLVELAERMGARVYGSPLGQMQGFPNTHPLYGGSLPAFPALIRAFLEPHDVVVVLGARAFYLYYYQPVDPLPPGRTLVHVHSDGWEISKNHRADVGLVSSSGSFIDALLALVSRWPEGAAGAAAQRRASLEAQSASARQTAQRARDDEGPLTPGWVCSVIADMLADVPISVVDEAVTGTTAVRGVFALEDSDAYLGHKGGALGWGAPAAIGAALAHPDRRVVCVVGDGSLMYCPQALYTAARMRLPILYVILNNAGYAIIKSGTRAQKQRSFETDTYIGMDLTGPEIDFTSLAHAMGVGAARASTADELRSAITSALTHEGPYVIECLTDRTVPQLPF